MPSWNPDQYLKFDDERTRPCRELVARIALDKPGTIVDLGCGPGNSTAVLAQRWPDAKVSGLDRSADMIRAAREKSPRIHWEESDIATWQASESIDLIFSNAALQWVPDHQRIVPQLFAQVAPGGALAWQVPANIDAPAHRIMRELATSSTWQKHFTEPVREWFVHPPHFYYDLLAPVAARVDVWTTEYFHVLESPAAIVEWYKGTGLRPFLDRFQSPSDRDRFLTDYEQEIQRAFPRRSDNRVLFPFLRQFFIAYRQ
ncbi:MAG TPA: trans-aconitate 2-methyltransferase [Chthoniobacter sp.]|jgi:trans-aconitate 2-methyltransferase